MKALFVFLLMPMSLIGQSVDTSVGGSQIMGMAGIQTSFQYKGRFGWTGIGYFHGFRNAGYLNMPLRLFSPENTSHDKYRLGIGDQELDSSLATDEFDFHRATIRGGSLLRHTENSDAQVFFGKFNALYSQPYFSAPYQTNPNLAAGFTERVRLSKTLTLLSFNTFGDALTSIQSLAWLPKPSLRLSTAEGIGSNHLYFANAAQFRKKQWDLRASYTLASASFHRQDSTYSIEPLGLNAKAEIPLGQESKFRFEHRHELITIPKYLGYTQSSTISAIDTAGITTAFWGFRASVSVDKSSGSVRSGNDYAGMASISRGIFPRLRSTFSYLKNVGPVQDVEVLQNTNEVRLSNHLTLSHNLDWINGNIGNTIGGRWSSNLVSFSADNQVYSSPVAAQFGQKSVFQAWNFSIRFRTPHGTTTHLETIIDPFGKTQWGGYLTGLQYRGLNTYSQDTEHVAFSKYVINGRVVDGNGKGIWGIALKVGGETVMSDTNGGFFVHVKNSKPVPFVVAAETSLQSLHWSLVSAPPTAKGVAEGATGDPLQVVVQMGRPVIALYTETKTIDPLEKPVATSSSDAPLTPHRSMSLAMQKTNNPLAIGPQVAAETVSASIRPHDLRLAELIARETESEGKIEPRRDADVLTASNKSPDLGIPLHFVIQKSPAVTVYEAASRTIEPSIDRQAVEPQVTNQELVSAPSPPPDTNHEQRRSKSRNSVWHAIVGYLFAPENPKKIN